MTRHGTILAAAALLGLASADRAGAQDGTTLLLQHTPAADWATANARMPESAPPSNVLTQAEAAPAVEPASPAPQAQSPPAAAKATKAKRPFPAPVRRASRLTRKREVAVQHPAAPPQQEQPEEQATQAPYGSVSSGTSYVARTVSPGQEGAKEPVNPIACLFTPGCIAHAFAASAPMEAPPPWPEADSAPPDGVTPGSIQDLVAKHAAENGVPYKLADAVVRIESSYNARTVHAGNYGLMQIRAATARSLGFAGGASGLLDPETNLRLGMKYLGQAYKMAKGDTCLTLMRYQSGLGTTRLSGANRAYCARARSLMAGL